MLVPLLFTVLIGCATLSVEAKDSEAHISPTVWYAILGGVGGFVVLLILCLIICSLCACRKTKSRHRNDDNHDDEKTKPLPKTELTKSVIQKIQPTDYFSVPGKAAAFGEIKPRPISSNEQQQSGGHQPTPSGYSANMRAV